MPELVVRSPAPPDATGAADRPAGGEPVGAQGVLEQVVRIGEKPLVVGRAEGCEIWIPEKKASRRHLRISTLPEGGLVAEDLGSANGTFLGDRRIARAVLEIGDVVRIGETTLAVRQGPDQAPAVGGTLALQPIPTAASVAAAESGPPPGYASHAQPAHAQPAPAERGLEAPLAPVRAPIDWNAMGRALAFLVVVVLGIGAIELFLGQGAREESEKARARREMRAILQRVEVSTPEQLETDVARFRGAHPKAREESERLGRWLDYARQGAERRRATEQRLNQLVQGQGNLPESEIRAGLLALQREVGGAPDLAVRIALALSQVDRKSEQDALAHLEDAARRADALMAAERPGSAIRLLSAVRSSWPMMPASARDLLIAAEGRAIAAAQGLADRASTAADQEPDPDRRRALLTRAWRGLDGTPQGDRLAEALRFTRVAERPGARATDPPTGPGATPPTAPLPTDVLVRAAEAEKLFATRRWTEARGRFTVLADEVKTGLLHEEWVHRVAEVDRILALVGDLDRSAKDGTPVRRKLATGVVHVVGASPEAVTFRKQDAESTTPWPEVKDPDVLPLLTPEAPGVEQRLSLAVLAATVSDREAIVRTLIPLLEKGERVEDASRLAARYLYGRSAPPEGGYRVYGGEILDRAGYERRLEAARLAGLVQSAEGLLAKVVKDPVFQKLEKLRSLRDELDKRRRYALLAIFNETHYPYPYDKGSTQYQAVQHEVDRRVAQVREIWNDTTKVSVKRTGPLEKLLEDWDRTIAALKASEQDVTDLEARMAPYVAYATGESLTVREWFRDAAERDLFRYNRWVMEVWNPSRTAVATDGERAQTQITNDYRMMLGFYGQVSAGDVPYASISRDNVQKVLDAGTFAYDPIPLKAVRLDDRLVRASRLHSEDMTRRGFFAHFAPPNPATGEGQTAPWDRMKKQGYEGGAASENIAGAGDPMSAHVMWCHSSGHHRNILSGWDDQGVGFHGRNWTQNYGNGGGGPTEVPEGGEVPAPSGNPPRDRR